MYSTIDTAARIRALREDLSIPRTELCEKTGMSLSTYRNYETGRRVIPADALYALADYFGTSTDYLLGRTRDRRMFH